MLNVHEPLALAVPPVVFVEQVLSYFQSVRVPVSATPIAYRPIQSVTVGPVTPAQVTVTVPPPATVDGEALSVTAAACTRPPASPGTGVPDGSGARAVRTSLVRTRPL